MTEKPDYAPGSIACIAFDAGAIWKQNEIIKTLEDPVTMNRWWINFDKNLGIYGNVANYVLAVIKGENK